MSTVSGLRNRGSLGTGVTLVGLEEAQAKLRLLAVGLPLAMGVRLESEGEDIMKASKPLVPIEDYDLIQSGIVGHVNYFKTKSVVEIGYGGPSVKAAGRGFDYSIIQHENESYNHTVGRSKFLYLPAIAHGYGPMKGNMERALISEIRLFLS